MALDRQGSERSPSRDRETPAPRSRPDVGIETAAALGRALDPARRPLARLEAMAMVRVLLEELEAIDVAAALGPGERRRLEDVGGALGMSKSAVHRKHGGQRWTP